jgi:hypothetical protein
MEGPVQPHRHSCTLPFTFRKVEPKIQGSEHPENTRGKIKPVITFKMSFTCYGLVMSSIALLGWCVSKKNLTTSFEEEKIPLDNVLSKYA